MSRIELKELETVLVKNGSLSKNDLASSFDDDNNYDFIDDSNQIVLDNKVNDLFNNFKRFLIQFYGREVFIIDNDTKTISFIDSFKAINEYRLCLYCMNQKNNDNDVSNNDNDVSLQFEKICAEALVALFGSNSSYELCDSSRKGRISIQNLAKIMEEEFIRDLQNNNKVQEGDGCCDVVFWKSVDNRVGKIIVLIQCKSGKNWKKGKSVEIGLWKQLINFSTEPIKAYAITDIIEEEESLKSHTIKKGLIFDRARIINLLATKDNDTLKKIRKEISNMELSL